MGIGPRWQVPPLPWQRSKITILLLLLAGCALRPDFFSDMLTVQVLEHEVWNDLMPGPRPRCHAVCRVRLTNISPDTIELGRASGAILDARSGAPLRTFAAVVLVEDREVSAVSIPPGASVELTARTPMAIPAIDIDTYPLVRIRVEFATSLHRPYPLVTDPVEIFITH